MSNSTHHLISASTRRRNEKIRVGIDPTELERQARVLEGELEDITDEKQSVDRDATTKVLTPPAAPDQSTKRPLSLSPENAKSSRPSAPLQAQIPIFADDIFHIERLLLSHMLSFTLSGRYLRFVHEPSTAGPFQRYLIGSESGYNTGRSALHTPSAANQQFLSYHTWLLAIRSSLFDIHPDEDNDLGKHVIRLRESIEIEFARLEDVKEVQWQHQQRKPLTTDLDDDGFIVDTGKTISRLPVNSDLNNISIRSLLQFPMVQVASRNCTYLCLVACCRHDESTVRSATSSHATTLGRNARHLPIDLGICSRLKSPDARG